MILKDLERNTHLVREFETYKEAYFVAEDIAAVRPEVKAFAVSAKSLEAVQRTHSSWFIGERVGLV